MLFVTSLIVTNHAHTLGNGAKFLQKVKSHTLKLNSTITLNSPPYRSKQKYPVLLNGNTWFSFLYFQVHCCRPLMVDAGPLIIEY